MAFVENENGTDWIVLFRSNTGNGSRVDQSLPETSIDKWVKGDTNVNTTVGNTKGGMLEEPDTSFWYEYCNRGVMIDPKVVMDVTGGAGVKIPGDGNNLLDYTWNESGDFNPQPIESLDSEGNFYPSQGATSSNEFLLDSIFEDQRSTDFSVPDSEGTGEYKYQSIDYPIIWRHVTRGSRASSGQKIPTWAENIFYKRITPWGNMDIKSLFLNDFTNFGIDITDGTTRVGNVPDIDFELYGSYNDAIETDTRTSNKSSAWWEAMSDAERMIFRKPKNPKRWKIYKQGVGFGNTSPDTNTKISSKDVKVMQAIYDSYGRTKSTEFAGGDPKAFPSLLGPTFGNISDSLFAGDQGTNTDNTPLVKAEDNANSGIVEAALSTHEDGKGDDIERSSDGVPLENAILSYENDFQFSTTYMGEQGLQLSEFKFFVVARELGCVTDFNSTRSEGVVFPETRYINKSNVPSHLKCTEKAPICSGYQAYSGDYMYDLSTKFAAGSGQIWGKCRGLSGEEVKELQKKAALESAAQRMTDTQALKVAPFQSIRDDIEGGTGGSDAGLARQMRRKRGLLVKKILNNFVTSGSPAGSSSTGIDNQDYWCFLYDQDEYDRIFDTPRPAAPGPGGQSGLGPDEFLVHKVEHLRTEYGNTILKREGMSIQVAFYPRENFEPAMAGSTSIVDSIASDTTAADLTIGHWKLWDTELGTKNYGFAKLLIDKEIDPQDKVPQDIKNNYLLINGSLIDINYTENGDMKSFRVIRHRNASTDPRVHINQILRNPGSYYPGEKYGRNMFKMNDRIRPAMGNRSPGAAAGVSGVLGTQGSGGVLQNQIFAKSSFENLEKRYKERLDFLKDQDATLHHQMKQMKKKEDKLSKTRYKKKLEMDELRKNERNITIDHQADQKYVTYYNIMTGITAISSAVILVSIFRGM